MKRLLSFGLTLIMCIGVTSCGNSGGTAATNTAAATAAATTAAAATDATVAATTAAATDAATAAAPAANGKVDQMRYLTPGDPFPMQDQVLKAVNDKLQADGVNINVSFIRIPWASYTDKLNAMLAAGEKFELMQVMQDVKNITSLINQDALQPIDQYLPNYPGLQAKFNADQWNSVKYDGKTYGIPDYWQDFTKVEGQMNTRVTALKTATGSDAMPTTGDELMADMQKMQPQVKQETGVQPYLWTHQLSIPPQFIERTYSTFPFFVETSLGLTMDRMDGTIDSYYESNEFKQDAQYFRKLYQAGLIYPDVLSAESQYKYDQEKLGSFLPSQTFAINDEVGMQQQGVKDTIAPFYLAPEKPHILYTLGQNLNAISATAENPEAPVKFLNWLYADKANHDLFIYGIKDVTYTATADDKFYSIPSSATDTKPLYAFDSWMIAYLPYTRYDERLPKEAIDWANKTFSGDQLIVAPTAGFLFDATNVASELTALQTEIQSSIYPIKFGLVDYDTAYPTALKKLKAAGLDDYVAEYKKQFAAYLAANPSVQLYKK